MAALERADTTVVLWLNQWVGTLPWLDAVVKVLISDYFAPVVASVTLLGLWFSGGYPALRERYQRGVMVAASSIGVVNIWVQVLNVVVFRPRPFVDLELTLLFYRPTDSSFPANPAAVAFAAAMGVYRVHRRLGLMLFAVAIALGVGRVYAGVFYPSDVIAGALLGIATTYLMVLVFRLGEPLPTLTLRAMRALCLA